MFSTRLLGVATVSMLLVLAACSSDDPESDATTTSGLANAVSPFACTTTGVGEWPLPGAPALEALRAAIGVDTLTTKEVTDPAAPALYTDDAGQYGTRYPRFALAYTKGADSGEIASLDALRALAPVIDGPAKAYFWAQANGWRVECKENWYRTSGGAHELAVSRMVTVCQPREVAVLRITSDGTVGVLSASRTGDAACL